MSRLLSRPYAPVFGLAIIVGTLPLIVGSSFHLRIAALVWVFGLAAIGLNILMGDAGQVSLGHAAFMGIGSYAVAIGPVRLGIDPLVSVLLGVAISCAAAYILGKPILRLRGYYLSVATLGLGYLVSLVIISETALTGGPDGMPVPRLTIAGTRLAGSVIWYWIAGVTLVIGACLAVNLKQSSTGRALRALHDSETAAGVLGIDVGSKKLIAFVVAAAYGSVAGSLLALMNGFATPTTAGFLQSIELVTMIVIGGAGSIFGAVVGAAVLVVLPQALAVFHEHETTLVGLLIMVFMIFLRRGIVPSLAALMVRRS